MNEVLNEGSKDEKILAVLSSENLVTKSNLLIEASYRLGTVEQVLLCVLASCIEPTDKEFKIYTLSIKDFIKLLNLKGQSKYSELREITKGLMEKVFEITVADKGLLQVAWLNYVYYNYNEGTVDLAFHPFLKPYLLDLKKGFTSYKLGNIVKFKSSYAIRLYEILWQYRVMKKRTLTVDELRFYLHAEDKYPLYGNFKQRILNPSIKEINKKSDMTIEYEEVKVGRSVVKINFTFTTQSDVETDDNVIDMENIKDVGDKEEPKVLPSGNATGSDEDAEDMITKQLEARLKALGVTKSRISTIFKTYDSDRIERNIRYTEERNYRKSLDNPAPYVIGAIDKDYAGNSEGSTPTGNSNGNASSIKKSDIGLSNKGERPYEDIQTVGELEEFISNAVELKLRLAKEYKRDIDDLSNDRLKKIKMDAIKSILESYIHSSKERDASLFEPTEFLDETIREEYRKLIVEQLELVL